MALGIAMLMGRFLMIIPALGDRRLDGGEEGGAGGSRHVPHRTPLFAGLLVGVVLIVGALTFFPALCLGPIVEHFLASAGKVY